MLEGDQDNTDGLFPEPLDTPQMQSFAPLCSVFRRFLKSHDLKYTQERADILDAIIARDGAFEAEELLLDLRARAGRTFGPAARRALEGRFGDRACL
ncbi:MAG: hypothetical protein K2V38_29395 [Gemmataceae bacterium]|nr:hypothetical protein [Gemmataceae bacterium]